MVASRYTRYKRWKPYSGKKVILADALNPTSSLAAALGLSVSSASYFRIQSLRYLDKTPLKVLLNFKAGFVAGAIGFAVLLFSAFSFAWTAFQERSQWNKMTNAQKIGVVACALILLAALVYVGWYFLPAAIVLGKAAVAHASITAIAGQAPLVNTVLHCGPMALASITGFLASLTGKRLYQTTKNNQTFFGRSQKKQSHARAATRASLPESPRR